ncbi:ferrous iron transport protein A [Candidatus Termititenax persephonae]|uniref:Ferrous iron transport protein A n=1 Tax=Candidatus Termititenax persephonae TaxID=2218525 RepID=A0A388TII8_9BACT|nr:ferrous iron transport protein A [Candidatus Termititenax persephonae]
MLLTELDSQQKACITKIKRQGGSDIVSRLVDMGLVKGVKLELIRRAPLGDPIEIKAGNFLLLSLRREEAEIIEVEKL